MKRIIIIFIAALFLMQPLNADPLSYAANNNAPQLNTSDLTTMQSISTISVPSLSGEAVYVRITPNNRYLYFTTNSNSMLVYDIEYDTFSSFPLGTRTWFPAITPDGTYGYTTDLSNQLNFFSIPGNVTGSMTLSDVVLSIGLAIAPNQKHLYVTDGFLGNVEIVDITNPASPVSIGSFTTVGGTNQGNMNIAITSDSSAAYVASRSGFLYPVTGLPFAPVVGAPIPIMNYGGNFPSVVVLSSDDENAYVGIQGTNGYVTAINNLTTTQDVTYITNDIVGEDLAITSDNTQVAVAGAVDQYGDGVGVAVIRTADNSVTVIPSVTTGYDTITISYGPNQPINAQGCAQQLTNDFVNNLSWDAPVPGAQPPPVQYNIYSDSALTNLLGSVPASGPLIFQVTNLNPALTYTYYIVAVDASGTRSSAAIVTVAPYDICAEIFPPSSITGCFVPTGNTVNNFISWTPPAYGPTPIEYKIFYDAGLTQLVAEVPAYVLSYEDVGVSPSVNTYYIVSVDTYGAISAAISITITDPCYYPSPYVQPDPPTNVIGKIRCNIFLDKNQRILTITWTASDSSDVVSYNIYNGAILVTNIPATSMPCFTTVLSRFDNGRNFSITAVDSSGEESVPVRVPIM